MSNCREQSCKATAVLKEGRELYCGPHYIARFMATSKANTLAPTYNEQRTTTPRRE